MKTDKYTVNVKPQDVSVIICAYIEDRWDDLVAAVESVQRQTAPPLEIIVVIDHNRRLLERARASISDVVVLESREPRGLSGARNSGIATAKGDVIAFLDDDAVAATDWLEWLARGYADPSVIGTGGSADPVWLNDRPRWFPEEFNWVVGAAYRGMPHSTAPVRNLLGCNMSFRKEVLETIGGFRVGFGQVGASMLRCDETELCIRARQSWRDGLFLYEPRARVYHRVPTHRSTWAYFRSRCYTEGLAKALMSRYVGVRAGLASERAHALRTLPLGIARGVAHFILRRELSGLARSGAIIAGLAITVAGYLVGTVSLLMVSRDAIDREAELVG